MLEGRVYQISMEWTKSVLGTKIHTSDALKP